MWPGARFVLWPQCTRQVFKARRTLQRTPVRRQPSSPCTLTPQPNRTRDLPIRRSTNRSRRSARVAARTTPSARSPDTTSRRSPSARRPCPLRRTAPAGTVEFDHGPPIRPNCRRSSHSALRTDRLPTSIIWAFHHLFSAHACTRCPTPGFTSSSTAARCPHPRKIAGRGEHRFLTFDKRQFQLGVMGQFVELDDLVVVQVDLHSRAARPTGNR